MLENNRANVSTRTSFRSIRSFGVGPPAYAVLSTAKPAKILANRMQSVIR